MRPNSIYHKELLPHGAPVPQGGRHLRNDRVFGRHHRLELPMSQMWAAHSTTDMRYTSSASATDAVLFLNQRSFPSVHRRYIHLALRSGSKVSQQMSVHQCIVCMQNMKEAKTIMWPDMYELWLGDFNVMFCHNCSYFFKLIMHSIYVYDFCIRGRLVAL